MPAPVFHTLTCFTAFLTERSADVRYAQASIYFHYSNIVAILLLLFPFKHAELNALCAVGSKSPAGCISTRFTF